jgi:hypothetical protein
VSLSIHSSGIYLVCVELSFSLSFLIAVHSAGEKKASMALNLSTADDDERSMCMPRAAMSEASKTKTRYTGLTNKKTLNVVEGVEGEEKDEG